MPTPRPTTTERQELLAVVERILRESGDAVYSREFAADWLEEFLHHESIALGNQTPVEHLASLDGQGLERVLQVIRVMQSGAYL
jgi:hypothetical protein